MVGEKTITLSQEEVQQVQAIIVDRDGEEALKFLIDVIRPRTAERESHAYGPLFGDWHSRFSPKG